MMPVVRIVVTLSCGCMEALVDDGGRLVVTTVNRCRPAWWCECADPEDPELCDHAEALLAEV
jgi:hypothetical protein